MVVLLGFGGGFGWEMAVVGGLRVICLDGDVKSINPLWERDVTLGRLVSPRVIIETSKKLIGDRCLQIYFQLSSLGNLELNWLSCGGGDVPPQVNLRMILIWTGEQKLAQPYCIKVCN